MSATSTVIQCQMNAASMPSTNRFLPIDLHVIGLGGALIQTEISRSVIFQSVLKSVTPASGSFAGGTRMVLTGAGFDSTSTSVFVGLEKCKIIEQSYFRIECSTPAVNNINNTEHIVQVSVCNLEIEFLGRCRNKNNFLYTYDMGKTPVIHAVQPTTITEANTIITVRGEKFDNVFKISIKLGKNLICDIQSHTTEENITSIVCLLSLPAGTHPLTFYHDNFGLALNSSNIVSVPTVTDITPNKGSKHGNTTVTIKGNGFSPNFTSVLFGNKPASVLSSLSNVSQIVCVTPAGVNNVNVEVKSLLQIVVTTFPDIPYSYSLDATPKMDSLSPGNGFSSDVLTVAGSFYSGTMDDFTVFSGKKKCSILTVTASIITCTLPDYPAGVQMIQVLVRDYGLSNKLEFVYNLRVSGFMPLESGFGGGCGLVITGNGFSNDSTAKVCGMLCNDIVVKNSTEMECKVPVYQNHSEAATDVECDIQVNQGTEEVILSDKYLYRKDWTSTVTNVSPNRGGTAGGLEIQIFGTNFVVDIPNVEVMIGKSKCVIKNMTTTSIVCVTGSSSQTLQNIDIDVRHVEKGSAIPISATFSYIDVWSSIFTWGGEEPPIEGMIFVANLFIANMLFHKCFTVFVCLFVCLFTVFLDSRN